jgi:D-arabinono-1,4-lactone oxidase
MKMQPERWFTRIVRSWLKKRTVWWPVEPADIVKCNSVADVVAAVLEARRAGRVLRVCGAQHSMNRAVFDPLTRREVTRMKLEGSLRSIERLGEGVYRVGAGCNFGVDALDPTSTEESSFTRVADGDGYALPLLGGMSAQTVGGFMSTASSGGSTRHGIADCIESFDIVDGHGDVRTLVKGTDEFDAAGVSMGLFGIITHATFKLVPRYLVRGTEQTVPLDQSMVRDGASFLEKSDGNEYVHALWFPNKGVENVLEFVGNRSADHDAVQPYFHPLHTELLNAASALGLYLVNRALMKGQHRVVRFLLSILNPLDKVPRRFNDHWWRVLPNDDLAAIATWVRVQFTEIWIDLADADEVLAALRELFSNDPIACGSFGVEVYAAKRSPFWMSMAYGHDVIRIDPYWLEYNSRGTLEDFFGRIWQVLLSRFPSARLHWGKHLPAAGTTFGVEAGTRRTMGAEYCQKTFPKFDEWLEMRARFDPDQVFMTDYWRSMFSIERVGQRRSQKLFSPGRAAPEAARADFAGARTPGSRAPADR